jgi:hypothetical protein
VPPADIRVVPLERGRLLGGRAIYAIHAPISFVRDEILDFASQADFRPMVLEARPLFAGEDGGEVYFRFRGDFGIEPEARCRYTVEEEEGESVDIRYEMVDPSIALRALKGGFLLRSIRDGEYTFVQQEFLVSALIMDRQAMLAELEADADAIRARVESMVGTR